MKKAKQLFSALLTLVLMCSVSVIAPAASDTAIPATEATYRDYIIEAALDNTSMWLPDYYKYAGGSITFEDLDFDGVPEFIVRDLGGSMHNVSNRVFYYAKGKLVEATAGMESYATKGYPGIINLYYNKTTGDMKYLGVWGVRNGVYESLLGNYTFSYKGKKVSLKYYSGSYTSRDLQGKVKEERYYNGAKDYGDFGKAAKISKASYNKINNSYTKGYKQVEIKASPISFYEWKNLHSTSAKRTALQKAYDGYQNPVAKLTTPQVKSAENTNAGVKIKWNPVAGAEKYRVFGYTKTGWKKVGDTTSASFVYKTTNSGATYKFTVRCIDKSGKEYTSSFNRSGFSYTFVAAPKLKKIANAKAGVSISWSKPKGAVRYKVFRKQGSGSWKGIGTTTAASYVDKTAKKGVTYSYTVRCISKDGKQYVSGYNTAGLSVKKS